MSKTSTPKKSTKATQAAALTSQTDNAASRHGKALVIVESPAKAKTINKYLGKDFIVRSSVGHVRDLPVSGSGTQKNDDKTDTQLTKEQKAQQALVRRMGVDPEHDWQANYEILPNKVKVIKELKSLAKDASEIYLATDLDREGEAIAWHLAHVFDIDPEKATRVTYHEITKSAIAESFSKPGKIDMGLVNAQQSRRILDRIV